MTNLIALPDGTELVGDYRIDRVLGAGGFGITYLADEMALHRRVTIKEYFPSDFAARANSINASPRSQDCAGDYRWGLDRFIEEAQTLAKFNHPHIVRVYRYFRANNTAYMVLHFEEGQSLKGWLKALGRAPRQKELDRILEPLLNALELIHDADFLHRDIAPDNIIIRKDGTPVLIDFGSARREIAAHSKTVSALVKPGYSPYEQYAEISRQQGPWTDIYALAATLYHTVTGRRPPDAPSRMVSDEYVPASQAALSSYRSRFLRAIDAAMALNVEARPRSIAAWRTELLGPDEKPSRGWLGRSRTGSPEAVANDDAAEDAPVAAGAASVQEAPPVNAGGGVKRQALADALAEALAGEPAAAGATVKPATRARKKPTQRLAKTVKLSTAPRPLRKKRTKKAADAEQPAVAKKDAAAKPGPEPIAAEKSASRKAEKEKAEKEKAPAAAPAKENAKAPAAKPVVRKEAAVPARAATEQRKLARPRANRSGQPSRWQSMLAQAILIGGLGTGVIAARNQFPPLSAWTGEAGSAAVMKSQTTARPRPATTASLQQLADDSINPLISQLVGHQGPVNALAYAPDGRSIVSAGADATVRIWTTSGSLARIIPLDHGAATSIAMQGDELATGHADGYVAVWDMLSGRKLADLRRNEASIWSLAFTDMPGRFLAAGHDWKVALWDLKAPAAPVHIFEGHESAVQAVAFSPNGPYLVSGSADRSVRLWNLNTLDLVRIYTRHPDFVTSVAVSPDGGLVASATLNGDIRIWSAASQRSYRRLRGHKDNVTSVAFSPDGSTLASASADGTVRLWDVERSRTLRTLASHPGAVTSVAFAPDGSRLVSAGDDGKIRVWSFSGRSAER